MRKGVFYTLEDYIITKNGEVINKHNNYKVRAQLNGKGYLRVVIGHKRYFVHRLVAEIFIPNPENKPQVNHKDGNKLNNSVDNLEWCNNLENRSHALKNNLQPIGEKCSWAKLTEKDAIYVLQHINISSKILSKKFNVSPNTINDIKKGRTWKHLKRYAELQQSEVVEIKDKKLL